MAAHGSRNRVDGLCATRDVLITQDQLRHLEAASDRTFPRERDLETKILMLSDKRRARVRRTLKWAVMLTTLLVNIEVIS